jgi:XTP/dITP diphosphohydrolase
MRIVLASNNPHKLTELQALLAPLGHALVTQGELGIGEADEPHDTFVENALAKARHAARASGLPAIADDSGICVDALGGAPGVVSARYAALAGRGSGDAANNVLLLERLRGIGDRRAHYCCVLVAMRGPQDPQPLVAEGRWHGEVALAPRGAHGFGYDPLFFLPQQGCTAAELEPPQKNAISHRAIAMRMLMQLLQQHWRDAR